MTMASIVISVWLIMFPWWSLSLMYCIIVFFNVILSKKENVSVSKWPKCDLPKVQTTRPYKQYMELIKVAVGPLERGVHSWLVPSFFYYMVRTCVGIYYLKELHCLQTWGSVIGPRLVERMWRYKHHTLLSWLAKHSTIMEEFDLSFEASSMYAITWSCSHLTDTRKKLLKSRPQQWQALICSS